MRTVRRQVAAVLVLGLVMAMNLVGVAHADEADRGRCTAGGDTIYGTVYHEPRSNGTTYVDRMSFTIQDNRAAKNNVYARLRGNGGSTTYWAFTSGDNIRGEQTYQFQVDEIVPRSANPYMKFHLTADQSGADPSCSFNVYLY